MNTCRFAGLVKLSFVIAALLLLSACSSFLSNSKTDMTLSSAVLTSQSKDGITIQSHEVISVPPEFFVEIEPDNYYLEMKLPFESYTPPEKKIALALPKNTVLAKISITNDTTDLIRLYPMAVSGIDASGNTYSPLTLTDMYRHLMWDRPDVNVNQLLMRLKEIRFIDSTIEIVPGGTVAGYLIFKPKKAEANEIWKFVFSNMPVKTDYYGKITKTEEFVFESVPLCECK